MTAVVRDARGVMHAAATINTPDTDLYVFSRCQFVTVLRAVINLNVEVYAGCDIWTTSDMLEGTVDCMTCIVRPARST